MATVYLNGDYLPKDEARVSVDDRGFLLADGVYEVTAVYGGSYFRLEEHIERMRRGLRAVRIDFDPDELASVHDGLLEENGLVEADDALVYVQVTRGAAPRTHAFPGDGVEPTVYGFAKAWSPPSRERWEEGYEAVTVPDRRWARVDIKSIALLPNVLAQQAAVDAGASESILVRDGVALEGGHANLFAVLDGTVVTHPATNVILPGISRRAVLELAVGNGVPVEERPIFIEELGDAEEVFLTGTTTEVRPVVRIDGGPVDDGEPGPLTRQLYDAFLDLTGATDARELGG